MNYFKTTASYSGNVTIAAEPLSEDRTGQAMELLPIGGSVKLDGLNVIKRSWSTATDDDDAITLDGTMTISGAGDMSQIRGVYINTTSEADTFFPTRNAGDAVSVKIGVLGNSGNPGTARNNAAALLTGPLAKQPIDHLILTGNYSGYTSPEGGASAFAWGVGSAFLPFFTSADADATRGAKEYAISTMQVQIATVLTDEAHPLSAGETTTYDRALFPIDTGEYLIHLHMIDTFLDASGNLIADQERPGPTSLVHGGTLSQLRIVNKAVYRIAVIQRGPVENSTSGVNGAMPDLEWIARMGQFDLILCSHAANNHVYSLNYGNGECIVCSIGTASVTPAAGINLNGTVSNSRTLYSDATRNEVAVLDCDNNQIVLRVFDTATGNESFTRVITARPRPGFGAMRLDIGGGALPQNFVVPCGGSLLWTNPAGEFDNDSITLQPVDAFNMKAEIRILGN